MTSERSGFSCIPGFDLCSNIVLNGSDLCHPVLNVLEVSEDAFRIGIERGRGYAISGIGGQRKNCILFLLDLLFESVDPVCELLVMHCDFVIQHTYCHQDRGVGFLFVEMIEIPLSAFKIQFEFNEAKEQSRKNIRE